MIADETKARMLTVLAQHRHSPSVSNHFIIEKIAALLDTAPPTPTTIVDYAQSAVLDEWRQLIPHISAVDVWVASNDPIASTVTWLRERAETAEARLRAHRASLSVCDACSRLVVSRTEGSRQEPATGVTEQGEAA